MSVEKKLVLTGLGLDRPGIVDLLSGFIAEREGNIEDSRMAALSGDFAVILLVAGTGTALDGIRKSLPDMEEQTGLKFICREGMPGGKSVDALPYRITLVCMDHPGVVHEISSLLAKKKINIESMKAHSYAAPITGAKLFQLQSVVSIPSSLALADFKAELEAVGADENVDVHIEAVQPGE